MMMLNYGQEVQQQISSNDNRRRIQDKRDYKKISVIPGNQKYNKKSKSYKSSYLSFESYNHFFLRKSDNVIRSLELTIELFASHSAPLARFLTLITTHNVIHSATHKFFSYLAAFLAGSTLSRSLMFYNPRIHLAIVWFRNDLRLHDHEALRMAMSLAHEIVPVYVFDVRREGFRPAGSPGSYKRKQSKRMSTAIEDVAPFALERAKFLIESVESLRNSLRQIQSGLLIRIGKPECVLPALAAELGASAIYGHADVSPAHRDAQDAVSLALERLPSPSASSPSSSSLSKNGYYEEFADNFAGNMNNNNVNNDSVNFNSSDSNVHTLNYRHNQKELNNNFSPHLHGQKSHFNYNDSNPNNGNSNHLKPGLECILNLSPWTGTLFHPQDTPFHQIDNFLNRYDIFWKHVVRHAVVQRPLPAPTAAEMKNRFPVNARILGLGRLPTPGDLLGVRNHPTASRNLSPLHTESDKSMKGRRGGESHILSTFTSMKDSMSHIHHSITDNSSIKHHLLSMDHLSNPSTPLPTMTPHHLLVDELDPDSGTSSESDETEDEEDFDRYPDLNWYNPWLAMGCVSARMLLNLILDPESTGALKDGDLKGPIPLRWIIGEEGGREDERVEARENGVEQLEGGKYDRLKFARPESMRRKKNLILDLVRRDFFRFAALKFNSLCISKDQKPVMLNV